jgi:hypothetical protein
MPRREDEGDEGGGEEHLDDSDVAVITAEYPREWVCVVDSEAFRGTYHGAKSAKLSITRPRKVDLPTARQLWSWLKVMKLRTGVAMTSWATQRGREGEECL